MVQLLDNATQASLAIAHSECWHIRYLQFLAIARLNVLHFLWLLACRKPPYYPLTCVFLALSVTCHNEREECENVPDLFSFNVQLVRTHE